MVVYGPHAPHSVWFAAPRGGRCACGPAKPVPRPLLVKRGLYVRSLRVAPAPRGGRCACGPAKPVPRPLLAREACVDACFASSFPDLPKVSKDVAAWQRSTRSARTWGQHCYIQTARQVITTKSQRPSFGRVFRVLKPKASILSRMRRPPCTTSRSSQPARPGTCLGN
jgi:hypothetical protein